MQFLFLSAFVAVATRSALVQAGPLPFYDVVDAGYLNDDVYGAMDWQSQNTGVFSNDAQVDNFYGGNNNGEMIGNGDTAAAPGTNGQQQGSQGQSGSSLAGGNPSSGSAQNGAQTGNNQGGASNGSQGNGQTAAGPGSLAGTAPNGGNAVAGPGQTGNGAAPTTPGQTGASSPRMGEGLFGQAPSSTVSAPGQAGLIPGLFGGIPSTGRDANGQESAVPANNYYDQPEYYAPLMGMVPTAGSPRLGDESAMQQPAPARSGDNNKSVIAASIVAGLAALLLLSALGALIYFKCCRHCCVAGAAAGASSDASDEEFNSVTPATGAVSAAQMSSVPAAVALPAAAVVASGPGHRVPSSSSYARPASAGSSGYSAARPTSAGSGRTPLAYPVTSSSYRTEAMHATRPAQATAGSSSSEMVMVAGAVAAPVAVGALMAAHKAKKASKENMTSSVSEFRNEQTETMSSTSSQAISQRRQGATLAPIVAVAGKTEGRDEMTTPSPRPISGELRQLYQAISAEEERITKAQEQSSTKDYTQAALLSAAMSTGKSTQTVEEYEEVIHTAPMFPIPSSTEEEMRMARERAERKEFEERQALFAAAAASAAAATTSSKTTVTSVTSSRSSTKTTTEQAARPASTVSSIGRRMRDSIEREYYIEEEEEEEQEREEEERRYLTVTSSSRTRTASSEKRQSTGKTTVASVKSSSSSVTKRVKSSPKETEAYEEEVEVFEEIEQPDGSFTVTRRYISPNQSFVDQSSFHQEEEECVEEEVEVQEEVLDNEGRVISSKTTRKVNAHLHPSSEQSETRFFTEQRLLQQGKLAQSDRPLERRERYRSDISTATTASALSVIPGRILPAGYTIDFEAERLDSADLQSTSTTRQFSSRIQRQESTWTEENLSDGDE